MNKNGFGASYHFSEANLVFNLVFYVVLSLIPIAADCWRIYNLTVYTSNAQSLPVSFN